MRTLILFAAVLAIFAVEAAAQTPLIGQANIARPGGVYTTLSVREPAACAQLCSEDAICMAWTFRAQRDGDCELKAVASSPVVEMGAISGLSSRAPDFARRLAAPAVPENASYSALETAENGELLGGPLTAPVSLRPRTNETVALH
ncbi:MAG: PAN domain-containing protein [Terricaulis sp.]